MLPSLDAIEEHLTAIRRRLPDISLRVISDALPQISAGMAMELRRWSSANEANELAATDIGLGALIYAMTPVDIVAGDAAIQQISPHSHCFRSFSERSADSALSRSL